MPSRFGEIKFNLMRAIELFQDMNHEDMDVTAPTSSSDCFKEYLVAEKLNHYLGQLIEDGTFDDCDLRDDESTEDDETNYDEEEGQFTSTPDSEGFEYGSDGRASKDSFTGRFKRYIRRMMPGTRRSSQPSNRERSTSRSELSGSSRRSQSSSGSRRLGGRRVRRLNEEESGASRSPSLSRERSGSEPYDPNVVYVHSHRHKHNHPESHHHHEHSGPHLHTFHSHDSEDSRSNGTGQGSHGLSDAYAAGSQENSEEEELSSGPLSSSRGSSRRRSTSSKRRGSRGRRSSRGRSSSRSRRSSRSKSISTERTSR